MKPEDTIKGHCFSNIDDVVCDIKEFARVPNIGERVFVWHRGNTARMKVVNITHDFKNGQPYIEVELWEQSLVRS